MRLRQQAISGAIRLTAFPLVLAAAACVHAQRPDCGCITAPSCQAWPGAPEKGAAGGYGTGDMLGGAPAEPYADTPFELGEAAPAQLGEYYAAMAPNFMGDFFGGPIGAVSIGFPSNNGNRIEFPGLPSGGVVGIQKLVENSSPIPRDRILFNYSYYNNVRFTPGGRDVNRYVVGFEKTFFDQIASIELRVPFASTLNSDLYPNSFPGSPPNTTNTEFGNLTLYTKALLLTGDSYAVGAGLGIGLPTADDINLLAPNGERFIHIENEAVQLMPYIGAVYAPNDRFFSQALLQVSTVTNGNPTYLDIPQLGLLQFGTLNDPTWLFASVNVGYWAHRMDSSQCLSGIAPTFELHYNTTLQDTDSINVGPFQVGDRFSHLEMVNLVAGVNFEFFGHSYLSLGYVAPVTNGADRFFDGELRVLFNRYFW
jgi:hypothetical protein